ncbi:MAG TPA: GYD domain-containing protein [Candidatus Binatia bacterium]|nr:GYD domain-containing protein [Candidatus Binatia bacterium]
MPTYVILIQFTQKGIEAIREGPARLDVARRVFQERGARLKDFYLVTGRYDAVAVAEAPDDATVAKLALTIASRGNTRTETLRAFTEEEYRSIVADLPKPDTK